MLNLDNIVSNKKKNSSENDDWPFRMLIIGPSGSGKTNTLLHLIDKFNPIDKIYLYAKDTDEEKRTSGDKKLKRSSCVYRIFK